MNTGSPSELCPWGVIPMLPTPRFWDLSSSNPPNWLRISKATPRDILRSADMQWAMCVSVDNRSPNITVILPLAVPAIACYSQLYCIQTPTAWPGGERKECAQQCLLVPGKVGTHNTLLYFGGPVQHSSLQSLPGRFKRIISESDPFIFTEASFMVTGFIYFLHKDNISWNTRAQGKVYCIKQLKQLIFHTFCIKSPKRNASHFMIRPSLGKQKFIPSRRLLLIKQMVRNMLCKELWISRV